MADRFTLIARKEEIRRQIEQLRRQLEQERLKPARLTRKLDGLERKLEALMAEEYNLRVAIDQQPRPAG
jgi:chromosome segregation ATPase